MNEIKNNDSSKIKYDSPFDPDAFANGKLILENNEPSDKGKNSDTSKFDPDAFANGILILENNDTSDTDKQIDSSDFDPDEFVNGKLILENNDTSNTDKFPDKRIDIIEPSYDLSDPDKLDEATLIIENKNLSDTNRSEKSDSSSDQKEQRNESLSDQEKQKIKEETGWSNEIIDAISSWEEYEVYKKANLHETEINGRKCLVKDIDFNYVDPKTGMTNKELMKKGRPPIDSKTGERIELHHLGQNYDGPFVELCENSEHGDGNHSILHTKSGASWRNDPNLDKHYNNFDRPEHWKARSQEE